MSMKVTCIPQSRCWIRKRMCTKTMNMTQRGDPMWMDCSYSAKQGHHHNGDHAAWRYHYIVLDLRLIWRQLWPCSCHQSTANQCVPKWALFLAVSSDLQPLVWNFIRRWVGHGWVHYIYWKNKISHIFHNSHASSHLKTKNRRTIFPIRHPCPLEQCPCWCILWVLLSGVKLLFIETNKIKHKNLMVTLENPRRTNCDFWVSGIASTNGPPTIWSSSIPLFQRHNWTLFFCQYF